ncbi:MAG: phage/plasmid replication domain-containing protein [Flavobacteriaceae bacterium]
MYDWLTATYQIDSGMKTEFTQRISLDSDFKNFRSGYQYLNGHITNPTNGNKMGVIISDNKIKINMCPNKFLLGNNVEEVGINSFNKCINNISEVLQVDVSHFAINRLDVTHTAQTEYKPVMYYQYLCNQPKFIRIPLDSSLYYNSKSHSNQKLFYDKVREVDKKKRKGGRKQEIPDYLKGKNLTRFEVRHKTEKQVANLFGKPPIVKDLFEEEYVVKLQDNWFHNFDSIPKQTEINHQFYEQMGKKQVHQTINLLAYNKMGRVQIENFIEEADRSGSFNHRSEKTQLRKELIAPFEEMGLKHSNIKELEEKYRAIEPKW